MSKNTDHFKNTAQPFALYRIVSINQLSSKLLVADLFYMIGPDGSRDNNDFSVGRVAVNSDEIDHEIERMKKSSEDFKRAGCLKRTSARDARLLAFYSTQGLFKAIQADEKTIKDINKDLRHSAGLIYKNSIENNPSIPGGTKAKIGEILDLRR